MAQFFHGEQGYISAHIMPGERQFMLYVGGRKAGRYGSGRQYAAAYVLYLDELCDGWLCLCR